MATSHYLRKEIYGSDGFGWRPSFKLCRGVRAWCFAYLDTEGSQRRPKGLCAIDIDMVHIPSRTQSSRAAEGGTPYWRLNALLKAVTEA